MYNHNLLLKNFQNENELEQKALRDGFGEKIVELAKKNPDIIVINADLEGSLRLKNFKEEFPNRLIQVGVAEQVMAGIGTGMALYGKIPFITSFAAFSPGLNWSNIRTAALSRANLKVVSSHYGLNVGKDGASAQMLSDIALMRVLPGMTVISPADFNQTKQAIEAISDHKGCSYVRVTRDKFPVFLQPKQKFEIGKAQVLKEIQKKSINQNFNKKFVTVVTTGSLVYETMKAIEILETEFQNEIEAEIINLHTIKPIDKDTIINSIKKTHHLVTIEEHYIAGGMGSAVLEGISEKISSPVLRLGVNDKFGTSGKGKKVMKEYGLDRKIFAQKIKKFLSSVS